MRARNKVQLALYAADTVAIVLATILAYIVRFEGVIPPEFELALPWLIPLSLILYLATLTFLGCYRIVLRYVGVEIGFRLAAATALSLSLLTLTDVLVRTPQGFRYVPFGVLFIQAILIFLLTASIRLLSRIRTHFSLHPLMAHQGGKRTLIIGAGSAGILLLRDIESNPALGINVIGFLDDDLALQDKSIRSVPVIGAIDTLPEKVFELDIAEIFVALPSAPQEQIRALLNNASELGLTTRIVPSLVIDTGSVTVRELRPVEVEDLLGREAAPIDVEQVASTISGKTVAVTGAAGSIGSELCRQIMLLDPAKLLLIETDESRLYELWLELGATSSVAQMCLCDITEKEKISSLLSEEQVDLVLHAAAYKHVPLLESAPDEAVRINVGGTKTLLRACVSARVKKFVLISTDKAVAPASVMGATKAIAELLVTETTSSSDLEAVIVRFGNVLGSRGSVVPLFEEQLRRGGPILVTHEEITRYFMTIPEAARLVLQAQAIGRRGDLFVLEMGEPVRIIDLAYKMIALSGVPAEIEIVGLRPAEKLHEVLVTDKERLVPTEAERIMKLDRSLVIDPNFDAQIEKLLFSAQTDFSTIRPIIKAILPSFSQNGDVDS